MENTTTTTENAAQEAQQCYHIWTLAESGNGMFRHRKCFRTRGNATKTVYNWRKHGDSGRARRPGNIAASAMPLASEGADKQFVVMKCHGNLCGCRKGKATCAA